MILKENYVLYNGNKIPKIALGTWQLSEEEAASSTEAAVKMGYRHIDTAAAYGNEKGVARGIQRSGVSRESLFITSKVPAEVKTYEGAKAVIETSLKNLETDYIDLMLIHAPKPWSEMYAGGNKNYFEENLAVWKAMEEAYHAGKLRAIGVSNFEISDIQNLLEYGEVKPMANQIRIHVGHTPEKVMKYCREKEILIMAYSPNATGRLLNHPAVAEMAAKYKVSVSQLCIRYDLQLGTLPLPKTKHEEYMRQNAEVDFEISETDMNTLRQVGEV